MPEVYIDQSLTLQKLKPKFTVTKDLMTVMTDDSFKTAPYHPKSQHALLMNIKFLKTYVYLFSTSAPNIPLKKNCHLSSVINSPPSSRQKNFLNYLELSEILYIFAP